MASTRGPFSPEPRPRSSRVTPPPLKKGETKEMYFYRIPSPIHEDWTYHETFCIIIHPSECEACLTMCQHYVGDTMDNSQALAMARQAQDDALSSPLQTKIDDLERRRTETLEKLTALRQKIGESRGELAKARRGRAEDHARLVEPDNMPRRRLADACEEERRFSAPGPSSFQCCGCPCPPSYPRPTDPSQTTKHEVICISSDSDDDVSIIPPPNSRDPRA